jgi:hypothetical protein
MLVVVLYNLNSYFLVYRARLQYLVFLPVSLSWKGQKATSFPSHRKTPKGQF